MSYDSLTTTQAEQFLALLRSETAASHKSLERLPVSESILSPTVNKESYANYLSLMYDIIADTEASIFPVVRGVVPDLGQRSKKQAIACDLINLGVKKSESKIVFVESGNMSTAFALGILYVIEGSSLGGRFILNHISAALGFDAENGARYFAGYGNKTGQMWKNFLETVTSYEAGHDCGAAIIAGADYAFRAIHQHFSVHSQA